MDADAPGNQLRVDETVSTDVERDAVVASNVTGPIEDGQHMSRRTDQESFPETDTPHAHDESETHLAEVRSLDRTADGESPETTETESETSAARLSERQSKVLEAIKAWMHEHGYPPSVRVIGDAVGLTSTSSVAYQLRVLEWKGCLKREHH